MLLLVQLGDRRIPGSPGGKYPISGTKIQGYDAIKEVMIQPPNADPFYIPLDDWKAANTAYQKGVATLEQLELLKWGHIIIE